MQHACRSLHQRHPSAPCWSFSILINLLATMAAIISSAKENETPASCSHLSKWQSKQPTVKVQAAP